MAIKTTRDLIDEVLDDAASHLRRYMEADASELPFMKAGVSPIEQVAGTGLWACVCLFNYNASSTPGAWKIHAAFGRVPNLDLYDLMNTEHQPIVSVWYQVKIDNYRADFVILCRNKAGDKKWVAVECDGHDHHNLTKEQAERDRARDRHFQAKGLSILRFTGSEIWRDPTRVATDAMMFAMGRMGD